MSFIGVIRCVPIKKTNITFVVVVVVVFAAVLVFMYAVFDDDSYKSRFDFTLVLIIDEMME